LPKKVMPSGLAFAGKPVIKVWPAGFPIGSLRVTDCRLEVLVVTTKAVGGSPNALIARINTEEAKMAILAVLRVYFDFIVKYHPVDFSRANFSEFVLIPVGSKGVPLSICAKNSDKRRQ